MHNELSLGGKTPERMRKSQSGFLVTMWHEIFCRANHQAPWDSKRKIRKHLPDKGGLQIMKTPAPIKQKPREEALCDSFTEFNSSMVEVETTSPSAKLNKTTTLARAGYVFTTTSDKIDAALTKIAPWRRNREFTQRKSHSMPAKIRPAAAKNPMNKNSVELLSAAIPRSSRQNFIWKSNEIG